MTSDTIKTPFSATPEGKSQLLKRLGSLVHFVNDDPNSLVTLCAHDRCPNLAPCPLHSPEPYPGVLGIVVMDPDRFYLADRIAAVLKGTRLGYNPGQPVE